MQDGSVLANVFLGLLLNGGKIDITSYINVLIANKTLTFLSCSNSVSSNLIQHGFDLLQSYKCNEARFWKFIGVTVHFLAFGFWG